MPFCNQCGTSVPSGARFCQACGSPLAPSRGATPSPSAPLPAAGTSFPPFPVPAPSPGYPPPQDLRPTPAPADLPFHPQPDEVIYREIVPNPRIRWRLMLGGLLSALVFLLILVPFGLSVFVSGTAGSTAYFVVAFLVTVFVILVVASAVYAQLAFRKFRYWITNHRTVGRRGVIGYSIDSIPLETISDVIVQRSIADRILGLSSIWVQPFGGGNVGGYGAAQYRFGALSGSNSFLGLLPADATQVQQLIFYLRDVRRRETGRLL